jgi:hypothetical protein
MAKDKHSPLDSCLNGNSGHGSTVARRRSASVETNVPTNDATLTRNDSERCGIKSNGTSFSTPQAVVGDNAVERQAKLESLLDVVREIARLDALKLQKTRELYSAIETIRAEMREDAALVTRLLESAAA